MPRHAAAVTEYQFKDNEYRWVQVYELLKQRILAGEYAPHAPLPSETRLEQELGVAKKTARKAAPRKAARKAAKKTARRPARKAAKKAAR